MSYCTSESTYWFRVSLRIYARKIRIETGAATFIPPRWLLFCLLQCAAGITTTASLFGQPATVHFQSIQDNQLYPQITCIRKDSPGFMWFGTSDGLTKYDGSNFKTYESDPADTNSLPYNYISALAEAPNHDLWVGTAQGLSLYRREQDNFSPVQAFEHQEILCVNTLLYDQDSTLWVGTSGQGLFAYDLRDSSLTTYTHLTDSVPSVASNFVTALVEDDEGNIWIGTREGLDVFRKPSRTFHHFTYRNEDDQSLSHHHIKSLVIDSPGRLWVGTYGGGLNLLEKKNGHYVFKHFRATDDPASISNDHILSLQPDHTGGLWIGTENGGLNYLSRDATTFKLEVTTVSGSQRVKLIKE